MKKFGKSWKNKNFILISSHSSTKTVSKGTCFFSQHENLLKYNSYYFEDRESFYHKWFVWCLKKLFISLKFFFFVCLLIRQCNYSFFSRIGVSVGLISWSNWVWLCVTVLGWLQLWLAGFIHWAIETARQGNEGMNSDSHTSRTINSMRVHACLHFCVTSSHKRHTPSLALLGVLDSIVPRERRQWSTHHSQKKLPHVFNSHL